MGRRTPLGVAGRLSEHFAYKPRHDNIIIPGFFEFPFPKSLSLDGLEPPKVNRSYGALPAFPPPHASPRAR